MSNWDGITRFYCGDPANPEAPCTNHNYFIYVMPTSGKVWLIPWDLDLTWGPHSEFVNSSPRWHVRPKNCKARFKVWGGSHKPAACDNLVSGLIDFGGKFFDDSAGMVKSGPLAPEILAADVDHWAELIADAVKEDHGVNFDVWQKEVKAVRTALFEERPYGHPKCQTQGFGQPWTFSNYKLSKDSSDLSDASICWLSRAKTEVVPPPKSKVN
jgi:hypothetical protein